MSRLDEILSEVQQLPQLPQQGVFDKTNHRESMLAFFRVLKTACQKSPEMRKRLAADNLQGTAEEIYERINASKHPVRNGLILIGNDLLEETEDPGTPEERFHQWRLAELNKVRHTCVQGTPASWIESNVRGCANGHIKTGLKKDYLEPTCPTCGAEFPLIPPTTKSELRQVLIAFIP